MNQCKRCFRLLASKAAQCPYCKSVNVEKVHLECGVGETAGALPFAKGKRIVIGRRSYTIEKVIDRGNMAAVVKVRDKNGRFFVLKAPLIGSEKGPEDRERKQRAIKCMQKEIERWKRLASDYPLQIIFSGQIYVPGAAGENSDKIPAILTEQATCNLETILKKRVRGEVFIAGKEKEKMISDIFKSLLKINKSKMVHRDLSLKNILAIESGNRVKYTVTDLGNAVKKGDEVGDESYEKKVTGSACCIDPVLFTDDGFFDDERIDIYGLGIIMMQIYIGSNWQQAVPGPVEDVEMDFEKKILDRYFKKSIDQGMLKIIKKCVTKDLKKRYRSLEHLQKDLERYFEKDKGALDLAGRRKRGELTILFKIPMPMPEITGREIEYSGENFIQIDGLCNCEIMLKNRRISRVKKRGSRMFKLKKNGKDGKIRLMVNKKLHGRIKERTAKAEEIKGMFRANVTLFYECEWIMDEHDR